MRKRAFIAALAATLTLPAMALPMGKRPDDSHTYYFDGSQFREGASPDQPAIATRTGQYPHLLGAGGSGQASPLPAGTGALAGICFIQQSGGKLGSKPAFLPRPGITVTVRGTDAVREARCDGHGFFSLALPPGR